MPRRSAQSGGGANEPPCACWSLCARNPACEAQACCEPGAASVAGVDWCFPVEIGQCTGCVWLLVVVGGVGKVCWIVQEFA